MHKKPIKRNLPVKQEIILGLDPGTNVMGYGLIKIVGSRILVLQYGVFKLAHYSNHELKLKKIFERVMGILNEFSPDAVALEAPFYGKNIQSMLKLGRAQGVAMAAALACEIPITEYAPKKIKQAVTGNGNASKEQVARMLMSLFQIKDFPKMLDASDALAVAVCHHSQKGKKDNKTRSWESYVNENSDRIIKVVK